jgi:hypothetical protein
MSVIPTRLLILQRICTLLATITEINGETVDLTGSVFRGRNLLGADVVQPALSILESGSPDIATFASQEHEFRKAYWTLLVEGTISDDILHPSDKAYWFVAAVEEVLSRVITEDRSGKGAFPDDYLLGLGNNGQSLITGMDIAPSVVRPPEANVSATAFFFLPIRVGIAVEIGRPFTTVS